MKELINSCDIDTATAMLRILNNSAKDTEFLKNSEYYHVHDVDPNGDAPTAADAVCDAKEDVSWLWELINESLEICIEMNIFHYFTQQDKMFPPAVKFVLKFFTLLT